MIQVSKKTNFRSMTTLDQDEEKLPPNNHNHFHTSDNPTVKPIGMLLQEAGLVSSDQVEFALQKQSRKRNIRLGEILALQGWIKTETANFFAEKWSKIVNRSSRMPIGQYFKEAGLLDDAQIKAILSEQAQTKQKFGELAVEKGWLKQPTLDFFLKNLASQPKIGRPPEHSEQIRQKFLQIRLKLLNLEETPNFSYKLLEEILFWTNGQSFLTQKLYQIISNSEDFVPNFNEASQVTTIVKTRLLYNWQQGEISEHLQAICNRLLENQQCEPYRLLEVYQKILLQGEVNKDGSREQRELLNLGLVIEQQQKLKVANRIYQSIFNLSWVEQQLAALQRSPSSLPVVKGKSRFNSADNNHRNSKRVATTKETIWRTSLMILILSGLLFLVFNLFLNNRLKVKAVFKQGNKFLQQGKYEDALSQYNKLLSINSNYYQAWTNRGYALAGLQRYSEMLASCSSATIIASEAVYAWNCQGEALHNLDRYEEAVVAFDRAHAIAPNEPIFPMNKSESLLALQEYDESLVTIDRAIELLEEIESTEGIQPVRRELSIAFNQKGRILRKKGEYQGAITAYERALTYIPDYFPAQIGKGVALKQLQKYQAASNEFRKILANPQLSDPQKAQTWFYLGQTFCDASQIRDAISAFESALELKPDYEAAATAKAKCS